MSRPRLLDLFCGAGGAAVGYHRAGFDVVGVDHEPQRHYPFEFHQGDALAFLEANALDDEGEPLFEAIHALPPCQAYTRARRLQGREHPDLLGPVRALLIATGLPYVIENVSGAPMPDAITLCGTSFGLGSSGFELRRHRLFESNMPLMALPCNHRRPAIQVMGHGTNAWFRAKYPDAVIGNDQRREALGVPWMVWDEIGEAIPPAFTEFVGRQILDQLCSCGARTDGGYPVCAGILAGGPHEGVCDPLSVLCDRGASEALLAAAGALLPIRASAYDRPRRP